MSFKFDSIAKEVVLIQVLLCVSLFTKATGQSGDVITIGGEQWGLLGKPIEYDSVLYKRLLAVLPKDRNWSTANWDGYTAYWSIRNNRLCLDRIEIERGISHVENIPEADMRKVFGKYYKGKDIVASWYNLDIRVGKGKTIYYVHMGYERNLEYEQIMTIQRGKVTNSRSYHNKVQVEFGFSFDDIKDAEEFKRRFTLHTQNYPELKGVKRLIVSVGDIKLDMAGNLLDCDVKVKYRSNEMERGNWQEVKGLSQEMKALLKKVRPWKTLCIYDKYVSPTRGYSFAYQI